MNPKDTILNWRLRCLFTRLVCLEPVVENYFKLLGQKDNKVLDIHYNSLHYLVCFYAFLHLVTQSPVQDGVNARDLSILSRKDDYILPICLEPVVENYFKLLGQKDNKVLDIHQFPPDLQLIFIILFGYFLNRHQFKTK